MTIALNQKVSLAKEVLIQELEGKTGLVHIQTQEYFAQNEIGTHILWILTESESIQVAYDTLLEEYEVEPRTLQQDLLNYLQKLLKHRLVEIAGG